MKKPKSRYRYYVHSAWGVMEDRLKQGDILLEEKYHGRKYTPSVYNTNTGQVVGGYVALFLSKETAE